MANISSIKLPDNSIYQLKDNGALQLTGGQVTGPVSFGDSVYISDLNAGTLIVTGNAAFTNNIQANTINGVEVGSNPKFTDTTYTFDGTYNASTNKAATVNTVINAINDLDGGTITGTPGAGKTITALSQSNGLVSATFNDISIKKSQISDFAHEHSHIITVGDKRNQGTTPNSYKNNLIFQGLKANPYINNPSTVTYSYLVGLRGWSDSSGGNSHEIAFNNSGIFVRQGATTVWEDWEKVLTDKNITEADINPIKSKIFTGVIGTANSWAGATFFYGSIKPTTWREIWRIKYRIKVFVPGQPDYNQMADVMISGRAGDLKAYASLNTIGGYYVCYYHELYRMKEAGFNNGYGHSLGVRFYSAYAPTDTNYKRTIDVEILETENCTFDFYDNCLAYTNIPGTGSTNYNTYSEIDFVNNGLQETGDSNDPNYYNRQYYGSRTTSAALYRYQFCLTKSDGTLVPINSVNNSIATNKTLTTDSFDPFGDIFFWASTSTYSAGANVGNGYWYRQYLADLRYSFNCGGYDTTPTLTARAPLYLVATPQTDGTAKLYTQPLSMELPTSADGLIYIYLGRVYEDTKPYRVVLSPKHPIYEYRDGAVRLYNGLKSKAAVSGGTEVSLVTTGEKYLWNSKTNNTGTVTSVAAAAVNNSGITISGSPITSEGTITIGLNLSNAINGLGEGTAAANRDNYIVAQHTNGNATYHRRKLSNIFAALNSTDITNALGGNKSANVVFAGPSSGTAATPSFRALVEADIPGLAWSKITSGNDDLKAIEALTGTSGLLKKTAANTWTLDTSTYLTGITSSQITSALGFTPYNATNPNGYTSNTGTVTSVQVQANSPLQSSTSTAQNKTLNTTISFIKQNANVVLAGPGSGSTTASPTFRALVEADIPSLSKSKISDFPTSMPPTAHTHGNISNTGTITSTTVTLGNGDNLLFADSSNSGKIERSSITIGTGTTKYLRQDGTWGTPAGTYSLPVATDSVRGGVKIGYSGSGKNYAVQLSNQKMYVNVPWTDTTYSAGTGLSLNGTTFSNNGVTEIKGNAESSYRTGQVNLTAANVGAVATTGNETVNGNKTFSGTTTITPSSTFSSGSGDVISANSSAIIQSPIPKYLWHDIWAFCRVSTPKYYTSADGSTWVEGTLEKNLFAHKEAWGVSNVLSSSIKGSRWTWLNGGFYASQASWIVLGVTYKNPSAHFDLLLETSSNGGSTWSTMLSVTNLHYAQTPIWIKNSATCQDSLRLTLTWNNNSASNAILGLCSIRFLTSRWGDQGKGGEFEYPFAWDRTPNIYPIRGDSDLGTSSNKWNNVYATTFVGDLNGSAKKLAQVDSITSLNDFIDSTYLTYIAKGSSNTIANKPSGVDAFGVLSLKTAQGYQGQLLMSSNKSSGLYWRTGIISSDAISANWLKVLDSNNYTDYTVTKSGTGANGNWGIDITGNADTATTAGALTNKVLNSTTIHNTAGSFAFQGSGEPWAGTDWVGFQVGSNVDKFQIRAVNGTTLGYRQNDSGGTNTSWGGWYSLLSSGNYTDYTVKKDGTGATGTWDISIAGNAANVTGTVAVGHGGTGATSFTSGALLIGNGTEAIGTRTIKDIRSAGNLGWTDKNTDIDIPTINTLAYWNGRYNSSNSNLTYCIKGAFGDAATKGVVTTLDTSANLPTAGAISTALDDYVTLTTAQTISGHKTFSDLVTFKDNTGSECCNINYNQSLGALVFSFAN